MYDGRKTKRRNKRASFLQKNLPGNGRKDDTQVKVKSRRHVISEIVLMLKSLEDGPTWYRVIPTTEQVMWLNEFHIHMLDS